MNRKAGFTLVELLVVIGIIGILIVALVPLTRGAIVRAKESAVKAQVSNIEAALTRFQASHGGYPGVELDVMAPYSNHALGDPALFTGGGASMFDAASGRMVNGVLGGLGHNNGVATGWAEQLLNAKNTPLSGNEDLPRYFDALLASDSLQEFPPNPFKTSVQGDRQPMRNIFTFQIDIAGGFDPTTSFAAGVTDPNTALYDCALVVNGGQGGVTVVDPQDTTRFYLRQNPLPIGATPQAFGQASVFGTDETDWFAPGDFAYIPVLSSSASLFGNSTATIEDEVYKWGTSVTGYMLFAYGDRTHKGIEFEDEFIEFNQTGMPGYGNPGVDTLYENYALQCFQGAIYYSKKF